jgi:DNA-binding NtrC family response regulator
MNKPLHVLIIEDSEDDCQLLKSELARGGYDVTYSRVETADAMRAALAKGSWDIILSDHRMPQFSSLGALKLHKERQSDVPFIVVSGNIGEELAVGAMKAGAHDYIMKDNLTRLVPAARRELERMGQLADAPRVYARIKDELAWIAQFFRDHIEAAASLKGQQKR